MDAGRAGNGGGAVDGNGHALEVVLIYEDLSTGLRANRILDGVMEALKLDLDFRRSLWRMDLLCEPALVEQSLEDTAKADVVFLSVHGRSGLPAGVVSWFKRWLARKGNELGALALVVDPSARSSRAAAETLERLQAAARSAGVEVFLHSSDG